MFNLDLEKAEKPEITANIYWIIKKARQFQKNIYFCFIDYAIDYTTQPLTVRITTNWKILRDGNTRPPDLPLKKQQLKLDIEQQVGSKLGKEYIKAVYCQGCICRVHHEKFQAG